jgi:hypothetical protein
MSPRPFLLLGMALALGACESPTKPLDSHDLQIAAQQVASFAGEGEWLAQQLREGAVTASFASVHQQALGEDAAKVSRDLSTKPVPASLRDAHGKLAQLNARVQVDVTRVAAADGHAEELEALQRDFRAIAGQARAMGQAS